MKIVNATLDQLISKCKKLVGFGQLSSPTSCFSRRRLVRSADLSSVLPSPFLSPYKRRTAIRCGTLFLALFLERPPAVVVLCRHKCCRRGLFARVSRSPRAASRPDAAHPWDRWRTKTRNSRRSLWGDGTLASCTSFSPPATPSPASRQAPAFSSAFAQHSIATRHCQVQHADPAMVSVPSVKASASRKTVTELLLPALQSVHTCRSHWSHLLHKQAGGTFCAQSQFHI